MYARACGLAGVWAWLLQVVCELLILSITAETVLELNSHKVSVTEDVTRGGWEHRIYVSGEDRGHMGSLPFGRAVTWSLMFWHVYVLGLGYFSYDLGHRTGTAHFVTSRKRIPSIFKNKSTGSCICLRSLIYMSYVNKVQPIRVKMIRVAAIRVTCMSDLRHVHDPVLSSLKMKGISSLFYRHGHSFQYWTQW
jgi:hypothetical protein